MKLRISIALLMALTPALASARPKTSTSHMRPQLFRDRAPKGRVRETKMRQPHGSTSKAPAPAALFQGDPQL